MIVPTEVASVLLFFGLPVFGGIILLAYRFRRALAEGSIDRWCSENKLRLLSKRLGDWAFLRGPFALRTWNRPVYEVVVEDQLRNVRTARVTWGSWPFGVVSARIAVVWDHDIAKGNGVGKRSGHDLE
jgi:hypothetical protein